MVEKEDLQVLANQMKAEATTSCRSCRAERRVRCSVPFLASLQRLEYEACAACGTPQDQELAELFEHHRDFTRMTCKRCDADNSMVWLPDEPPDATKCFRCGVTCNGDAWTWDTATVCMCGIARWSTELVQQSRGVVAFRRCEGCHQPYPKDVELMMKRGIHSLRYRPVRATSVL